MLLFFDSSATNAIIAAKDHASVQISVADVDEEGRMTGGFKTYAFCGKVRGMVRSDAIIYFNVLFRCPQDLKDFSEMGFVSKTIVGRGGE